MMASVKQVKFESKSSTNPVQQKQMTEDMKDKEVTASSVSDCNADQSTKAQKKEYRKRMKGLLTNVKKQMEFYLGDANINKDGFMKQKLEDAPGGYLPISLFLTFSKIQSLTENSDIIVRALAKSDLLEVSEDKTQVRRKKPVHYMTQEEIDARTVYVEGLPRHADHDWVSNHFSACGTVAYVSLPRYRQTGDIKGFAFVEFETPEEAARAAEKMNRMPETVPEEQKVGQSVKPLKNLKYWRNRAAKEGIDPDKEVSEPEPAPETSEDKNQKKSKKQKKRRRRTSEGLAGEEGGQPAKRAKTEEDKSEAEAQAVSATNTDSDIAKADSAEANEPPARKTGSAKEAEAKSTADTEQRKALKRKRKSESVETKEKCEADTTVKVSKTTDEGDSKDTKAESSSTKDSAERTADSGDAETDSPKKAVKREADSATDQDPKKKKQKEKQATAARKSTDQQETKESAESRKRKRKSVEKGEGDHAKKTRQDSKDKTNTDQQADTTGGSDKKKKRKKRKKIQKEPLRLRVMSKKEWTELKREYLDRQRASMANLKQQLKAVRTQVATNTADSKSPAQPSQGKQNGSGPVIRSAPEFIPDVIVEVKSDMGMNYKQLKEQIDKSISLAYVDVKDNQLSGHIRCKDADSARKLASSSIPHCTLSLVQGEAEKAYWEKMARDRENKLNTTKKKNKRGTAKLLEKAQNVTMESMQKNHVIFDEA